MLLPLLTTIQMSFGEGSNIHPLSWNLPFDFRRGGRG